MNRLTWHGHATFPQTSGGQRLLFEPWLDEHPAPDAKSAQVMPLDCILCSHDHSEHHAAAIQLRSKTNARILEPGQGYEF